ncbi:N-acetylmuramoyl-L-alanine amidase [Hemicordylus capensis]|uniref:N-acetylmuramoyl-L-alanine amidase n=1 Tax=Hemicordylus capensis TaxID=884348 RepID=UPI0023025956|nr:N-acetylmuramoyl-L-alanine amidase [Hemicordylus capensis]
MFLMWLGLVPVFLCVTVKSQSSADNLTFHTDTVIQILEVLESHLNETLNSPVIDLLWDLSCSKREFCQSFLNPAASVPSNWTYLNEKQEAFLKRLVNHKVDDSLVEHGVVLTPDGTTVSFSPVVLGIAAGLKKRHEVALPITPLRTDYSNRTDVASFLATIARDLGIAFILFHRNMSESALGPNGCWDSISAPHTFTLMSPPSPIPDAFINGAMDGLILGTYLAEKAGPLPNISTLLSDYYGGEGLEGKSRLRSNFRRRKFAGLVSEETLWEQVKSSLHQLQHMDKHSSLFEGIGNQELISLTNQAVEEFMALYVECPAIIPRCMWRARPYKGTPTQLKLPLGFVYIHHTHSPRKPCLTFPACAADMRSMQRFHQDDRGWDDIGYSFVAGSDGYLYQGRGWHWVGAHTRGYNSKGYGISFIGDYMQALPDPWAMDLVKDNFMKCAVRGSRLQGNYTVYGHRQMGPTLCPGDKLFKEIETWKGFKHRCEMREGIRQCI